MPATDKTRKDELIKWLSKLNPDVAKTYYQSYQDVEAEVRSGAEPKDDAVKMEQGLIDMAKNQVKFAATHKAAASPTKGGSTRNSGATETIDFSDEPAEFRVPTNRPVSMTLAPLSPQDKKEIEEERRKQAARQKAHDDQIKRDVHDPAYVQSIIATGKANCANYGIIFSDTCRHFADYAEKKVEEFKEFSKAVAPVDLFSGALEILASVAAGRLGSMVTEALGKAGKEIAEKIKDVVDGSVDALKEGIAAKLEKEDRGVEGLQKAIKTITDGVADLSETARKNASQAIEDKLKPIYATINGGGQLEPDASTLITNVAEFSDVDEALESIGIPSEKTARATQSTVLKQMIAKFEAARIKAVHEALGDFPGKEALSDRSVDLQAAQNAEHAVREMDEKEKKTGRKVEADAK